MNLNALPMKRLLLAAAATTAALACAPASAWTFLPKAPADSPAAEPYFQNTYLIADVGQGSVPTIARPQGLTPKLMAEAARARSPAYVVYSSPRSGNLSVDDVFFGQ